MMTRILSLVVAVTVVCRLPSNAEATCNEEQVESCQKSASNGQLSLLRSSGECIAKRYMEFSHLCSVTNYLPNVDFCCCHYRQQLLLCCRYHQDWNRFRCQETDDAVGDVSSPDALMTKTPSLKILLPSTLVPLLVLVVCLIVCFVNCCNKQRTSEGKCRPGFDKCFRQCCKNSDKRRKRESNPPTRYCGGNSWETDDNPAASTPLTTQCHHPLTVFHPCQHHHFIPLEAGTHSHPSTAAATTAAVDDANRPLEPSAPPPPEAEIGAFSIPDSFSADGNRLSSVQTPPTGCKLNYVPGSAVHQYFRPGTICCADLSVVYGFDGGNRSVTNIQCPTCMQLPPPPSYSESQMHRVITPQQ